MDLSGSQLDLGGTHAEWSVGNTNRYQLGTLWSHKNCQWGALLLAGSRWAHILVVCWYHLDPPKLAWGCWWVKTGPKSHKSGQKRPWWVQVNGLDLSEFWLDLGGTHPGWSVSTVWAHQNCHQGAWGGGGDKNCHESVQC